MRSASSRSKSNKEEDKRGFPIRYTCGEFHTRPIALLRYDAGMRFLPKLGCCRRSSHGCEATGGNRDSSGPQDDQLACGEQDPADESHLLKTVGWISAGLGALAIGLIVGREIRRRYKFNRRTPYDLYAHSGDELHDADCSVGI
jgi:hypothetical protein